MEQNKRAMSRLKKIIIAIAAALLALVLILGITVFLQYGTMRFLQWQA